MNIYLSAVALIAKPNKYTKWYCELIEKARKRANTKDEARVLLGYTEGHHIFPRCFEEDNSDENFAYLTAREHFVAHRFLAKMFDGGQHQQMFNAIWRMACCNDDKNKISSRTFQYLREQISKSLKGMSYEERFGDEKAKILKQQISERLRGITWEERYGDRSNEIRQKISKPLEERFTPDEVTNIKAKLSRSLEEKVGTDRAVEVRMKMSKATSASKLGKKREPFSDEWKFNISNARLGKSWEDLVGKERSDILKRKMSDRLKGRIVKQETIEKIRAKTSGRKDSKETCEKKSKAHTGKKRTESQKKNMSKALRKRMAIETELLFKYQNFMGEIPFDITTFVKTGHGGTRQTNLAIARELLRLGLI